MTTPPDDPGALLIARRGCGLAGDAAAHRAWLDEVRGALQTHRSRRLAAKALGVTHKTLGRWIAAEPALLATDDGATARRQAGEGVEGYRAGLITRGELFAGLLRLMPALAVEEALAVAPDEERAELRRWLKTLTAHSLNLTSNGWKPYPAGALDAVLAWQTRQCAVDCVRLTEVVAAIAASDPVRVTRDDRECLYCGARGNEVFPLVHVPTCLWVQANKVIRDE